MRKVIINILIILAFILIYLLQANFFMNFRIAGIMPNLFVIFILFIGLFGHKLMGPIYGIIFGLLIDLFIAKKIGINAIMLGIIGAIGIFLDKNFSKDNRLSIMIMIIVATAIFEIGSYALNFVINKATLEIGAFIQILTIEIIYNVILTIILYPIINTLGNKIETEYKGNKILTRYF